MASSSNSLIATNAIGHPVTERLTKTNYPLWKLQVLPALRGAQLIGYVDGTVQAPTVEIDDDKEKKKVLNPAYVQWLTQDQQVFSYLVSSLSREVLTQVATCTYAAQLWKALEDMYASQTRARIVNTRIALTTAQKGNMMIAEYVGKMKTLADEMATAGKPIDDEELVSYIITGLDLEYNPVISAVLARVEPITVNELYTQLTNFEQRVDLWHGGSPSSVNTAARRGRGAGRGAVRGTGARGRGANCGRGNGGRGRGGFPGNNNKNRPANNFVNSNGDKPMCQVCFKEGHTAADCWHRYDETYVPDQRLVNAATSSYTVDTNWYADTGATDHIMGELQKLTTRDRYTGGDQIILLVAQV